MHCSTSLRPAAEWQRPAQSADNALTQALTRALTQAPEHRSLIPLVESALAVMRLSCEKYFVLLSVLVAHLLFGERPPPAARAVIRANARLSTAFQKVRPSSASLRGALRRAPRPAHSVQKWDVGEERGGARGLSTASVPPRAHVVF